MSKIRIVLLFLVLASSRLEAEHMTLSLRITDSQTGEPVADARAIVRNGPAAEATSAEMVQKNREFQPKTLIVAKGSEVNFPNRDNTQHHVYSFSPAKVFNLELFADQPEAPVVFDKTGVVEVGCNIHDQMQGFILVTNSALTARTDQAGVATLSLPDSFADVTEVSLWHPRLKNATQTVDFTVDLPASEPVELTLELAPERKNGRLDGLQRRFRDL